jgi:hypothetical protein
MNSHRRRNPIDIALYSVPSLAVIASVALLLIGVSPRVIGARIYGGPPFDGSLSLRFLVLEHSQGIFIPQSNVSLALHYNRDSVSSVSGRTDSEGAWESRIPLGSFSAKSLSIELLANGIESVVPHADIPTNPPSFAEAQHLVEPALSGSQTGDLRFSVELARAIIATPFDEPLIVHVSKSDGQPAANAKLSFDGDVLINGNRQDLHLDAQGYARVLLRPLNHAARLEISATIPGTPELVGSWSATLPVQAGALWLDPTALRQGSISVLSPVRHRSAYLTAFNRTSRIFATRLELLPDDSGGAQGSMPLPSFIPEAAWLLVSPDPPGQGQEIDTLAWPLTKQDVAPACSMHTPLLFDGMPAAIARARSRSIVSRRVSTIVLAFAAFIESVLLLLKTRHSKRELDALLSSQAGLDDAVVNLITGGHRFWLRLVGASLVVAVALSALALVTWIGPP